MKLSTPLLLLVASSFCLFLGSLARVEAIPLNLLESLKGQFTAADVAENVELPAFPVEEEIFERTAYVDELPSMPIEEEIFDRTAYVDELPPMPETRANECSVTIRGGITNPQPVFLETDSSDFYPYSDNGVMQFDAGRTLQMWCPNEFTKFSSKLLTASCVSGSTFRVDGTSYDFKEFVCKSWPAFVAERTGDSCNGGIMVRVGFRIDANRFAEQMEICFDEDEEVTRYVHHDLGPANNYYQTGVDRLTFQTGGFFDGKNVDKLYTQVQQQETINDELDGVGAQYFDNAKNIYLARGHMGAKADFVYGTQQRATFLFINTAPQWQVFNAGNWARVEDGVRAWVSKNKMDVECYTGVYGVTTLPNNKGVETPLYLAHDANNNGLIPVPMLYFRVIIEPSTERGIVLVGVNNPHLSLEQIKRDYVLCNDVSDQVTYVNWKKTEIVAGYSYACEVEEFLEKVSHLPDLSARGGLLV